MKDLESDYAHLTNGVIDNASLTYASIEGLTAGSALIQKTVEGRAYIADLFVNSANIESILAEQVTVRGSDGQYWSLVVDADGNITGREAEIDGETVIDSVIDHTALLANSITTRELNVDELFANEAFIQSLTAGMARFDALNASEALIGQLKTAIISSGLQWSAGENLFSGSTQEITTVTVANSYAFAAIAKEAGTSVCQAVTFRVWLEPESYDCCASLLIPGNGYAALDTALLGAMLLGNASTNASDLYRGNWISAGSSGWSEVTVYLSSVST